LEAKVLVEEYRGYYNHHRLHSALDYQTPAEFVVATDLEGKEDAGEPKGLESVLTLSRHLVHKTGSGHLDETSGEEVRILYAVTAFRPAVFYGGPSVGVARHAASAAERGHQVTVVTSDVLDLSPVRFVESHEPRLRGCRRTVLSEPGPTFSYCIYCLSGAFPVVTAACKRIRCCPRELLSRVDTCTSSADRYWEGSPYLLAAARDARQNRWCTRRYRSVVGKAFTRLRYRSLFPAGARGQRDKAHHAASSSAAVAERGDPASSYY
jgi:hypothetical protein